MDEDEGPFSFHLADLEFGKSRPWSMKGRRHWAETETKEAATRREEQKRKQQRSHIVKQERTPSQITRSLQKGNGEYGEI